MRESNPVVAICVSDIHLSHKPPSCRRTEIDWYAAQRNEWEQLARLWAGHYYPPILIAGDLFDRWNPPIETVEWALAMFSELFGSSQIYAIPGQHDLPNHALTQMRRSAYGLMVRAGAFVDLSVSRTAMYSHRGCQVFLCGYPWGTEPSACPLDGEGSADVKIAMAHRYAFPSPGYAYEGAGDEGHIKNHHFSGFDVVHYGDNHMRWVEGSRINPGTFYRRFAPDAEVATGPYLVGADGMIASQLFKHDHERFMVTSAAADVVEGPDPEAVIEQLGRLSQDTADVPAYVNRYLQAHPVGVGVRQKILSLLEE